MEFTCISLATTIQYIYQKDLVANGKKIGYSWLWSALCIHKTEHSQTPYLILSTSTINQITYNQKTPLKFS